MKIFLIIPTLKQGGAERVMSVLANNLSQSNHEVHLVLLAHSKGFYKVNGNVNIHHLGFQNKGAIQKKISEINTFLKLRKLLKKEKPEATLSFMDKYNVLTILASSFLNLNIFVSDRSNPKKKISSSLQYLKKLTYKYATGIVAQTSLAKEVIYGHTKNTNIEVIANPLKDIVLYPDVAKEKIIINVGRLIPEKGQKFLIDAFSNMKVKDWKLVILGDGNLKQTLKCQIDDLGLTKSVIMPGAVSDVDHWLARASIFAFSSVSEGFPNALVEAMAAGLPCVSFDCDAGPKDIISNGLNGFLIDTKNVEALASKLDALCLDINLRIKIGEEATKVRDKLNANMITKKYINFFMSEPK